MRNTKVEVCVESLESALTAQLCGADRIELCSALTEGGVTPSFGLASLVCEKLLIGVHVIIRPRRGDFCYTESEFECMKRDIITFRQLGVSGFVFGILTDKGEVDKERNAELIALSRPVSVTFHRAFDAVKDPYKALQDCIELGVDRILTSGLQQKAEAGIPLLKELNEMALGRIVIMPGSGVNESNIKCILLETGAKEIHLSAKERISGFMKYRKQEIPMNNSAPLSEYDLERTSADILSRALEQLEGI